jgi:hypothetical protein
MTAPSAHTTIPLRSISTHFRVGFPKKEWIFVGDSKALWAIMEILSEQIRFGTVFALKVKSQMDRMRLQRTWIACVAMVCGFHSAAAARKKCSCTEMALCRGRMNGECIDGTTSYAAGALSPTM